MSTLMQLTLYIVTVVKLTSSQFTENEVNTCESSGVFHELMKTVSRLQIANSQLQRDVAELKVGL